MKIIFFFSIIKRDGVCEHDFEKGRGQSRRCWKGKHDQNTLYACVTFSKNIFKMIKSKKKASHGPTPSPAPRDVTPFLTGSEQRTQIDRCSIIHLKDALNFHPLEIMPFLPSDSIFL